jgi:hypothetical protein
MKIIVTFIPYMDAQDSIVISVTCYVLDGPGIKSRYSRAFSCPAPPVPELRSHSFTMGVWSFTGVKRQGACANYQLLLKPKLRMG